MNKIAEALIKRFETHRIIFWYDEKEEFVDQYQELNLSEVEKIYVEGNEFEVKHRVSKQAPEGKFLLYFTGEIPANEDNWLLDIELAHHVFRTDQEAMFLQEMGLGYHFKDLVTEHLEFFKAKERRAKLKEFLGDGDEHKEIRGKMLAVVFGTENISLVTYIHAHGSSFSDGNEKYEKDLQRYNLADYYWSEIKRKYNYENESPSIYDFLLEVFNTNFALGTNTGIKKESRLLLSLWKDTILFREYFGKISDKIAQDIDVEGKLNRVAIDDIISDDLFKLTDIKVIHELVNLIDSESISNEKVIQYVKQRENKFWFAELEAFYQSIIYGAQLIALVRKFGQTKYTSFEEGTGNYAATLYEVDQVYRKFIYNYRKTTQNKILADLSNKVEKVYSNDWLLIYNNNWQSIIDKLTSWPNDTRTNQQSFFDTHVKPVLDKKQRLFVIISDAFRYECGAELAKRLQSENRYEATLNHMISSLPSYTQLGMASLLPHKALSIQDKSDIIFADGMSSSGTANRTKILEKNSGVRATAIKAEDFMNLNSAKEGREFVKMNDLIYIYHNRIDKTGDDKTTEEKVFEAVEDELQFLMEMMKKIANMNGTNMFITSDHGFIYQHNELDESDFSTSKHTGEIWKENRRFVIGENITNDNSTKAFKGADLGIQSDVDFLITKSINRLRVKGAGSRFIHGGASLQEVVIPLIKIVKTRQDTTSQVDIDIIKSTDRITTNILAVSFIQTDAVSEQVLPRTIRASICAEDGELLSDQFKYIYDIIDGSERQREVKHRFQLSSKASGKYKNQRVKLLLEEPVDGANKWRVYKEYFYTLNISFTNDFDEL
ncbi:BREX-1 system phosphatase PglZ type A [Flavobacterium xueshanense]|uniref:TIGR02687 family protein n=1 Tax=Flavobacterium xueshanense TaxID=935223 RepID=A0A1I2IJS1_9FLAO|nr:BREX-1 system phosphatase PglZ type A [Flavobacterium xueshanense]SFF42589.1 TIGR02687 family protein [Flavobacterium xueshanense]